MFIKIPIQYINLIYVLIDALVKICYYILQFVLAAREITSRLRLHGFWADFMNPFSGKPFYSWANGKNLYRVDQRFRGLNMKLFKLNQCTVISSESDDNCFSGAIYTNAPSNYLQLKSLLDNEA